MRKISLLFLGILAFTIVVSYINADEARACKSRATQFKEFLQGSVVGPDMTRKYGRWTAIKRELITGSGIGNLKGSPIEFTLVSNRRFKMDDQKSFINGRWKFVLSDGSQISGIFIGSGKTPTEFSGMFVANNHDNDNHDNSQKSAGIYSGAKTDAKIMGMFSCKFLPPQTYGGFWRYEAWWNGTIKKGES